MRQEKDGLLQKVNMNILLIVFKWNCDCRLKTGGGDRYPDLAFIGPPKYLVTLSKRQLFCLRSVCLSWIAELLYHLTDQHVQKLNLFTCQLWIKIIWCAHKIKRIHLISNAVGGRGHGFSAGFYILLILRYIILHIKHGAVSQYEPGVLSQKEVGIVSTERGPAGPIQSK